jgi:hypothetical protein
MKVRVWFARHKCCEHVALSKVGAESTIDGKLDKQVTGTQSSGLARHFKVLNLPLHSLHETLSLSVVGLGLPILLENSLPIVNRAHLMQMKTLHFDAWWWLCENRGHSHPGRPSVIGVSVLNTQNFSSQGVSSLLPFVSPDFHMAPSREPVALLASERGATLIFTLL